MKTRFYKPAILLALMVAGGLTLNAQSLKTEDSKEFSVNATTELSIDNQFGNITVTDWDQNKIVVAYIIEVTNGDEAKAKKLMDKIKIDIKEEGGKIRLKTIIDDHGNLNFNDDKGKKQSMRIDYFVKCPGSIKISLDNQFGDMILGSLTGPFSADLQFGSLKAVKLDGPGTKISLQFGQANIGSLKEGKVEIQHCELLKIDDSKSLSLEAQFTEVELGTIGNLKAEVNSSKLNIDELSESLKLESNMGSTKIGNVSAGFKSITAEQNMGDLSMGIDPKAGYSLNAEVSMGSVKLPDGFKRTGGKEEGLPGVTSEKVTGTFGSGTSTIKVSANMGSVKIK